MCRHLCYLGLVAWLGDEAAEVYQLGCVESELRGFRIALDSPGLLVYYLLSGGGVLLPGRGLGRCYAIFLHLAKEGCLEAAEGEVVTPLEPGAGQCKASGIASLGGFLDCRTARIPEAEDARRLVESLACGIVNGLSEQLVLAVARHQHQLGMAARHYQAERREARLRLRYALARRLLPG